MTVELSGLIGLTEALVSSALLLRVSDHSDIIGLTGNFGSIA